MYKKSANSIGTLISHGKHRQTHGKLRQTVEWLLSLTMKNLKRGRHLEYRKIHEQKKRGHSVSTVSGLTGQRKDHWRQWDNFPSQSWDFEYHWQGWTKLLPQQIRRRSLNWSGNTKVELQFNAWELFWQLISIIFFRFWACFPNLINEHASFNRLWLLTRLVN